MIVDRIQVMVVDDHPLFRRGVVDAINSQLGMAVVAEAESGEEALGILREQTPDVLTLDVSLPGISGIDLVKKLRRGGSSLPIVILSMYRDEKTVNEALNAGVDGYMLKEDSDDAILHSIRDVSQGRTYLTSTLQNYFVNRIRRSEAIRQSSPGLESLTEMEWRVLRSLSSNKTSREIAQELGISYRTVQKHRENTCQKLDLRGSNRLLEFAMSHRDEILHLTKDQPPLAP